jgi:hypothetical protein
VVSDAMKQKKKVNSKGLGRQNSEGMSREEEKEKKKKKIPSV